MNDISGEVGETEHAAFKGSANIKAGGCRKVFFVRMTSLLWVTNVFYCNYTLHYSFRAFYFILFYSLVIFSPLSHDKETSQIDHNWVFHLEDFFFLGRSFELYKDRFTTSLPVCLK